MIFSRLLLLAAWPSLLSLAAIAPTPLAGIKPSDPLHVWAGHVDAAHLNTWVDGHLAAQQQAIQQLLAVPGTRTVANTLVPYDQVNAALTIAGQEAYLMYAVSPDKAVREAANGLVQKISEAGVALSLNQPVYKALAAIDATHADPATRHYLERTLLEYRLAGVDRDDATRKRIAQLQERITQLGLAFGKNVQESVNTVAVHSPGELAGLPADYIAHHKPAADGTITLTTDFPDMAPVMTYAKSAALRREMYLAYSTQAYPVNTQVLLDLLTARQELATTLGFKHWADLATADQMIGSAANVRSFLAQLDAASKSPAEREYKMVLDFAKQQQPGLTEISIDSRGYWYEQYRSKVFNFDSQSVRPYFPYAQVQQGILDTAARLFHVEFRPDPTAPVWDPSVTAWDVYDREPENAVGTQPDGSNAQNLSSRPERSAVEGSAVSTKPVQPRLIGRFYLDMHPRAGKDKWFSQYPIVPGIAGKQIPEGALICNFPGGKPGEEGLMQYNDVVTFFHEFGHLMHAILGGQQQWAGVSGITTEGDFIEAPSQMLEEFFRNPKLLQSFAKNDKTGEVIPTELVERMDRASAFGRGDWVRAQLFYTRFALDLHDMPPADIHLDALLKQDFAAALPYTWVDGNRMYASFTHLVGYSSNYYTYLYDKVIALDFYSQFDPNNLVAGPTALRYRKAVLEPGGSEPGTELVKNFLGREQNLDAFKKWMNEEFEQPVPTK
jgi:thimet oligopeptidase